MSTSTRLEDTHQRVVQSEALARDVLVDLETQRGQLTGTRHLIAETSSFTEQTREYLKRITSASQRKTVKRICIFKYVKKNNRVIIGNIVVYYYHVDYSRFVGFLFTLFTTTTTINIDN